MICEKPIVFNTRMVMALLDNKKTQTRIVIKPQPILTPDESFGISWWYWKDCQWIDGGLGMPETGIEDYAPFRKNDIIWVRETWNQATDGTYVYKTDDTLQEISKLSIHMPHRAARIFLHVIDVRAERLQEISEKAAVSEGCEPFGDISAKRVFMIEWNNTHVKRRYGWDTNPWVWVIEFERIS